MFENGEGNIGDLFVFWDKWLASGTVVSQFCVRECLECRGGIMDLNLSSKWGKPIRWQSLEEVTKLKWTVSSCRGWGNVRDPLGATSRLLRHSVRLVPWQVILHL